MAIGYLQEIVSISLQLGRIAALIFTLRRTQAGAKEAIKYCTFQPTTISEIIIQEDSSSLLAASLICHHKYLDIREKNLLDLSRSLHLLSQCLLYRA